VNVLLEVVGGERIKMREREREKETKSVKASQHNFRTRGRGVWGVLNREMDAAHGATWRLHAIGVVGWTSR
jgi:hypothetical protein